MESPTESDDDEDPQIASHNFGFGGSRENEIGKIFFFFFLGISPHIRASDIYTLKVTLQLQATNIFFCGQWRSMHGGHKRTVGYWKTSVIFHFCREEFGPG